MEIVYQSWFALSSVDYDSDAENEDLQCMKNLQEVRNVADWKWISGDIEMQQY